MEYISILGIVLGIAVYVFMALKKMPLYFTAIVAALIIAITSLFNPYTAITDTFMSGMAGLLKQYFLLFLAGSLFGKAMDDTGCARKIAMSLANLTKRSKNQAFWLIMVLPAFYLILSYVGVSGFVIVFTMLQVARDLFREADIPWRFFTFGSSGIVVGYALAGNMNTTNVMATEAYGVPLTAGLGISLVFAVVYLVVLALLVRHDMSSARKRGEGFLPSGKGILEVAQAEEDRELPNIFCAALPLIFSIVLIAVFKTPAVLTLLLATIVCFAVNWKFTKHLRKTVVDGLGGGIGPVINVSAANGFASVIRASVGFGAIALLLGSMPGMFSSAILTMGMTAAVGSSSSWLSAFLPTLMEFMEPLGWSPELCARFITLCGITMMVPHNPGPVNAISLCRLDVGPAVLNYLKGSIIPGAVALAVCMGLIAAGVFV